MNQVKNLPAKFFAKPASAFSEENIAAFQEALTAEEIMDVFLHTGFSLYVEKGHAVAFNVQTRLGVERVVIKMEDTNPTDELELCNIAYNVRVKTLRDSCVSTWMTCEVYVIL